MDSFNKSSRGGSGGIYARGQLADVAAQPRNLCQRQRQKLRIRRVASSRVCTLSCTQRHHLGHD